MTNFEFYKNEIKEQYEVYKKFSNNDTFTQDLADVLFAIWKKHRTTRGDLLDWLCEEHQILDEEEKEYLSAIIKPFRDRITCISKEQTLGETKERIIIKYDNDSRIALPFFEKGKEYMGMKIDKDYTLKGD